MSRKLQIDLDGVVVEVEIKTQLDPNKSTSLSLDPLSHKSKPAPMGLVPISVRVERENNRGRVGNPGTPGRSITTAGPKQDEKQD